MSNFSNARKLNAVYKDSLAVVNTNSNLDYYDEVNIGSSYRNTVDVSDIKIDTIPSSPDFENLFSNEMGQSDLLRFGININTGDQAQKKYNSAYLDDSQTVIKFSRAELTPVGNSVDSNGGSYYCLDQSGKNLLEDMIPYTAANSLGQLDDSYENTKLEYYDGTSYINIILQTNYHGNAILNHRQGLVTFNSNPSWSLVGGNSVPITTTGYKIYFTFYKYVGKKGIRVLNSTDVSGGLVVGGEYSGSAAPADGAIIQGKVGIGTEMPDKKLHISEDAVFDSIKISNINNNEHIGLGYRGIVKYQTGTFTLGLQNNSDLKLITNNTERMRINGDGNIGIGINNLGTDIPLEIFGGNIYGSGKKTRDTLTLRVNRGQGSKTSGNHDDVGFGARLKFSHNTMSTSNGNVGNSTSTDQYVAIESVSETFYSSRIGLKFITDDGSPAEKMRIDASGNVGIGTSTPQHKLDVSGGNIRVTKGRIFAEKTDDSNEGGEIQIASQTEGTHNGYWTFDSYKDKFRLSANGNFSVGSNALLVNVDTTNGLNKVGINKGWNYSQTEALDVSGNIRIDNGNNIIDTQGGQLIFDNGYNKPGPNKILLYSDVNAYGIGIDSSHTVKYLSSKRHKWYHDGQINQNGTLGMTLYEKDLTVEQHITGKGDLTLPTHKLSTNTYTVYESNATPKLTFKGINGDNSSSTGGNLDININGSDNLTKIKLSSGGASFIHSNLNVGSSSANTNYMLNVDGTLHASNNISTDANISATGTITQSGSGTNTFYGHTYFGDNGGGDGRVRVHDTLYSNKVVAGLVDMTTSNDRQLLVHNGSSYPGTMRINNFGLLEFTNHYSTGQDIKFGSTPTTNSKLAVADWKIEHGSKIYDSTYGDNLAFTFKRTLEGLTTTRENTVLRLCPSSWEDEPRANNINPGFESGLTYNAIFNGDVKINGNLVVELSTSTRDTIVEHDLYNAGIAVPSEQILRLSDNDGASQIRFDKTSDNQSVTYTDYLTANDTGKILLSEGARITVPATDTIGYHVFSSGSHRFYTSNSTNNELRLRIDNTNNVVIGSENGNSNTLDYATATSRTPSLLNLWNSTNDEATMIQFSNGSNTHPYRIGINSGSGNQNKFSVVTSDDTDIFTIDTENKKFGINSDNPNNTSHGKILDINGGIAVNYDDNTQFSYIGKLQIGKVLSTDHVGFSHKDSSSYGVAHKNDGTLLLNGVGNNVGSGIYFNISDDNRMLLTDNTFTIGGIGTSTPDVNIVHAGNTQHTGNMTIAGDLLANTSNHNITMNDTDKIKLDDVTIDGGHIHIAPSNNITYYSVFNEPGLNNIQNTTIRAGTASSNIIIGDLNTSGKIYIGHTSTSNVNATDYFIQSKPIALSQSNNNSLYTTGNVNIDGNLNMNGPTKQIDINSGKLTIANATGDVVSQGNLSLNNVNSTENYFKIYDNASNEKFSVKYSSGNTIIKGTLNVNSQPFTVGGTIAGDETIQTPKFEVKTDGTTTIMNKLTINDPNNLTGIQLDSGDLVIKNQNIKIIETNTDGDGNEIVSFKVDHDGKITDGTWNADFISTIYGGLGANVSDNGVPGLILISQGNGEYLPKQISCDDSTINITANGDGINITSDVQPVTIDDFTIADSSTKGLMSADDKRAIEIIREFMFADNSISQTSDANKLHEGLVRKVKTYRTSNYYQFTSATMSKLFVGSFLYDINKPAANYSDYGMVGESFYLDVNSGDYTIPNDTNLLSTNFSQTTTNDYRVLFWQDYITTSDFGSIDIEFQCPYHEVDFSISNYKYNTVLYVQDYKFNPLSEPRAYNDMTSGSNGKILAEGRSQVKSDKGPRGQMFPLNGHFDYVSEGRVRIMVLVNTSQNDTDSNARLDIDARNAYLKVTELNDTNAT
jgi:hypothetical protein